jgi:ferredoxin
MEVSVDDARCQGHTLCALNAPELFELSDDDGHARPAMHRVPPELQEAARRAVADCPERAITVAASSAQI